jgi:stearoyl-CoA desaturase (delta-9 desaturase)
MLIAKFARGERLKYHTLIGLTLIHIGAFGAIWTYTLPGLISLLVLFWITGGLGICLGYHRLLTHGSFSTYKPLKWIITFFGVLALQGGPASWAAAHRLHHREVEQEMDPHTPLVNFLWSHFLWLFFEHPQLKTNEQVERMSADIVSDPVVTFMERNHVLIYSLGSLVIFAVGFLSGMLFGYSPRDLAPGTEAGLLLGASLFCWGVLLRTVLVWHATWLVNSATHVWGYRNFDTEDDSRNSWWVSLITFGEGWHNNHHADQRSAAHGMKWYEFDATWLTIRVMAALGLAWDVVHPRKLDQMS